MQLIIRKEKPVPSELGRIATGLINQADRVLATPGIEAGKAVHEARKSMKKLRALVRLTQAAFDRDSYCRHDKAINNFSGSLGGTRDSTILISSLQRLARYFQGYIDASVTDPALQKLQQVYDAEMRTHLAQVRSHLFERKLNKLRKQLAGWDFEKVTVETLSQGLEQVFRKGRKTWKLSRNKPTTNNIHALRKEVKYLWYIMRMLRERSDSPSGDFIDRLERLGELLGDEHDLAILAQHLRNNPELCADTRQAELITGLADARRRKLLANAMHIADELYADKWKKSFLCEFERAFQQTEKKALTPAEK